MNLSIRSCVSRRVKDIRVVVVKNKKRVVKRMPSLYTIAKIMPSFLFFENSVARLRLNVSLVCVLYKNPVPPTPCIIQFNNKVS